MKKIFFALSVLAAMSAVSCVKDEQNPDALVPEKEPEVPVTLCINELDPNNKKIELYNYGSAEIDLAGCYMTKDGGDKWDLPSVKLAAGALVVYTAKSTDPKDGPSFGMSATKGFILELFNKKDEVLDKVDNSKDSDKFFEFAEDIDPVETLGRKTDGSSEWVIFKPGTIGTSNSGGTVQHNWGEVPQVAKVVLNELNGNDKYIELYNAGNADASLAGWTIYKDGGEEATWTGAASLKIAPGQYVVLYSEDVVADHSDVDASMFFASGLSAKKTLKIEIKDASGASIDVFTRGTEPWNVEKWKSDKEHSYSRVPDGEGPFVFALPTEGAKNGEKVKDIEQE